MTTSKPHADDTGDAAGSASISSAEPKSEGTAWSWVLALFGTAMGAGILFLPLQAAVDFRSFQTPRGPWHTNPHLNQNN
ncbi:MULTISPECIES: hypothetical protein [Corynebacterium]|uniref:hypothetical protein n=1 Tax=Corynebacterium sp. HMSC05E07 TaxID=1581117 RepID=UPI000B156FB8